MPLPRGRFGQDRLSCVCLRAHGGKGSSFRFGIELIRLLSALKEKLLGWGIQHPQDSGVSRVLEPST